ncbi:MAG: efflux RND transporter periplasmic adaptor subunit [Leptospira sp.]|jgi:Cu(I)/Ag(I) efflux system membrane fusion protein|nr:efflux RND transporter periplasmic adaptor subunit [Leptospira sp.]
MKKLINKFTIIAVLILFVASCSDKLHDHKEIYTCPMHPQIEMDHPGECPICGMTLVKKETSLKPETQNDPNLKSKDEGLEISNDKQQILNLDTVFVERGDITKNLNFSGQVAYNPEIFSTANEYKSISIDNEWSNELKRGVRLKFTKLGLSEKQIAYTISKNEKLFLTGRSGNTALLIFQVYENDLQFIKIGKFIEITNQVETKSPLKAKIVAIGNLIDQETRTLSVWAELSDPAFFFKPQMYVQGIFEITKPNVLRIPKEAILPTGKSDVVYAKTGDNQFAPKKVHLGFQSSEWVEVLHGLEENEEIVSKASFLLDSETKLKLGDTQNDQHNH